MRRTIRFGQRDHRLLVNHRTDPDDGTRWVSFSIQDQKWVLSAYHLKIDEARRLVRCLTEWTKPPERQAAGSNLRRWLALLTSLGR